MKVAVVLSVYRHSSLSHVKECLESLYAQTCRADIMFRIDGEIPADLRAYLERQKECMTVWIDDPVNRGIVYSYNQLFKEALERGYDYIARMDSDDIALPDRFEVQTKFLERNPEIGIVGGYIQEFGEYDKIVRYPLTHKEMLRFFYKRVPLANVTTMFRRSTLEKIGLYPDSRDNEDTLMWLKAFRNGIEMANIDRVLVKVRSDRGYLARRKGWKKACSDLKDRYKVARELRFGWRAYVYALGVFAIQIAPNGLRKLAYKYLR